MIGVAIRFLLLLDGGKQPVIFCRNDYNAAVLHDVLHETGYRETRAVRGNSSFFW